MPFYAPSPLTDRRRILRAIDRPASPFGVAVQAPGGVWDIYHDTPRLWRARPRIGTPGEDQFSERPDELLTKIGIYKEG